MMNLVTNIRQRYFASAALLITLFYIFFLWRFWQYGIEALGINVTFFWLLLIGFFLMARWNTLTSKTLLWLAPFTMMIVSLSIYTNPFTTWISVLIAPILFFIFTTHESHQNLRATLWSKFLPVTLIYSAFKYLGSIAPGISFYKSIGQDITPEEKKSFGNVAKQVVLGLAILFILSVLVIIPLLSSADASFASMFYDFFEKLFNLFEFVSFAKLFNLILGFLLLMGGAYYWRRKINPIQTTVRDNANVNTSLNSNSITVGIVLAGVLFLYLMFIFVQIKTIFINALPIDFENTESLVKTGFWQLFLLTILNILFYVGIYNKYTKNVQRILMAFTLSSLLLISSAGYKVFMYVTDYGLSYEKFFAFYTVIFCVMVFAWFISLFVRRGNERVNIICSLAFMALWMYAFATIIPLERFIFNTNLKLTQQENSRVDINELQMLGFDVLSVVEENFDVLIREAREDYLKHKKDGMIEGYLLEKENYNQEDDLVMRVDEYWIDWIHENKNKGESFKERNYGKGPRWRYKEKKKWYEKTFGELIYNSKLNIDKVRVLNEKEKMKTFKDSIHGFSVDYPASLRIEYDDSYDVNELRNEDFRLYFSHYNGLYIDFYNSDDKDITSKHESYIELLKNSKESNCDCSINLPNLPNVPVYTIVKNKSKDDDFEKYHKIIFEVPQGIVVISSGEMKYSVNLEGVTSDEYIELITSSKEFQDVIKSFRLIETTK